ncbi:MAG TPA: CHAT domain-containing tetratricopeptide repeat protein, partial [Stellaceae bacterium]|nr:CHAT domain-containing tetratricopeptide repeat protein [Stellaceae bacterium]
LGSVIRNNLAGLDKERGRYDEAETLYRAVLDAREQQNAAPLDLAASLNNLAELYDAQGRFADAEPLLQRALALREKVLGSDHPDVAQALNNLAGVYWAERDLAKAEPLLRRAADIREKTLGPDDPEAAAGLNNLAVLYSSAGRLDEALAASARAVAAVERHLTANAGENTAETYAEYRKSRAYFANYVEIAHGVTQAQPDRAHALAADSFRVAQLAQETKTASAVALMAARFAAGADGLATMIRQRQDLAAHWRNLDANIVALATRPAADRDALGRSRAELAQARQALQTLDARLAAERPTYAALAAPKPVEAAAIEGLLDPDEAMLVYFLTNRVTWLWVVRSDGIALFKLQPGAQTLASAVGALRSALTPDLPPFPALDAHALYEQIVGPASLRLADAHRLIVVPDGALQSLPFALLVTDKPDHDPHRLQDYGTIEWLARRYATSILPAVSSLPALRRQSTGPGARKPFLGIGNPLLAGAPTGERGAASEAGLRAAGDDVRRLPALPETADELRQIAQLVGAGPDDLLLGAQASEAALRQAPLNRYRIIEFATHGLLSGELKDLSEPALVLTPPEHPTAENDGLLTASKIAGLELNADLIVLSACNTAEDDGTDTGGWSALAKSFFYAGARSLLISHWPVWSKATVALTSGIFDELKK